MNDVFKDILGYYEKDKWFFWDEAGLESGPFNSEKQAEEALSAYIKYEINWEENIPIRKMKDNMGI